MGPGFMSSTLKNSSINSDWILTYRHDYLGYPALQTLGNVHDKEAV